jgi:hypothetical protein
MLRVPHAEKYVLNQKRVFNTCLKLFEIFFAPINIQPDGRRKVCRTSWYVSGVVVRFEIKYGMCRPGVSKAFRTDKKMYTHTPQGCDVTNNNIYFNEWPSVSPLNHRGNYIYHLLHH